MPGDSPLITADVKERSDPCRNLQTEYFVNVGAFSMNRLELEECCFRARELGKRVLHVYRLRDQENKERVRFSRYPTPYPCREAAATVLNDEVLDETTAEYLLKELGRIGGAELADAALQLLLQRGSPPFSKRLFDAMLSVCSSSYQADRALALLQQMEDLAGLVPDVRSCNLTIAACSHSGRVDDAFRILDTMLARGLRPNSFTATMLLQACLFKNCGRYHEAVRAYRLMDEACPSAMNGETTKALLAVCTAAMHHAASWADAKAVFEALRDLQLSDSTTVYNALLKAVAKRGHWQVAHSVFEELESEGIPADIRTYSLVIQACVAGGALDHALEVFEWMVAGRAAERPMASDIGTFNHLIRACHQAGRLEKALEITAWVHSTGVDFDQETYEELIGTVEIAQMWDSKAIKAAIGARQGQGSGSDGSPGAGEADAWPGAGGAANGGGTSLAVFPAHLRPAPYDGMRLLYLDRAQEHEEEEQLARQKLGTATSWVAATMLKGYPPSHFLPGGGTATGHVPAVHNRKARSPVAISIQPSLKGITIERVLQYSSTTTTPETTTPPPALLNSHLQQGSRTSQCPPALMLPPLRQRGSGDLSVVSHASNARQSDGLMSAGETGGQQPSKLAGRMSMSSVSNLMQVSHAPNAAGVHV